MSKTIVTAPLTTIFTPAATCTLPLLSFSLASNIHVWNSDGGTTTILRVAHGCYPQDYFADNQLVLYSPGVCPFGQTMADIQFVASDGATRARCCPSNAAFVTTTNFDHCASPATSPGTLIIGSDVTTAGSWVVVQKAVVVEWKSADLGAFTPSSAPLSLLSHGASSVAITSSTPSVPARQLSTTKPTSTSATGTISTPASNSIVSPATKSTSKSTSTSQAQSTSSSFSTGAKVGTGVGAAIGGIIVILLIALVVILRKKKSGKAVGQPVLYQQSVERASYRDQEMNQHMVHQTAPYEMNARRTRSELDGYTGVAGFAR